MYVRTHARDIGTHQYLDSHLIAWLVPTAFRRLPIPSVEYSKPYTITQAHTPLHIHKKCTHVRIVASKWEVAK
jgi:hypothetical protein